jgi:hypothetical protein
MTKKYSGWRKSHPLLLVCLLAPALLSLNATVGFAQTTSFSYQGPPE